MAAKTNFRGSFTALVTPFKNGSLDEAAFRGLCRQWNCQFISGLTIGRKARRATGAAAILPWWWRRQRQPTAYLVFCPHIQSNRARTSAIE